MKKTLFCIALNPEVLYETFAHGMTSINDSVQTFAITFMRNVIVRAMKFPSAAVNALAPFQLYLQEQRMFLDLDNNFIELFLGLLCRL